jgi:hypothetical protein
MFVVIGFVHDWMMMMKWSLLGYGEGRAAVTRRSSFLNIRLMRTRISIQICDNPSNRSVINYTLSIVPV